jgi:hypothetical protein
VILIYLLFPSRFTYISFVPAESRRYFVYKKAYDSLKLATKEFSTPMELLEVKYIGPDIIAKLEKRSAQEQHGGPSQPAAPQAASKKPRGRPLKRSATEIDIDPPPVAKRRTVSAAEIPARAPMPLERSAATMPAGEDRPFQFWYIGGEKKKNPRHAIL